MLESFLEALERISAAPAHARTAAFGVTMFVVAAQKVSWPSSAPECATA